MKTWIHSIGQRCGGCGQMILAGAPLRIITTSGQTWKLYRGECCADESAPELMPLPERTSRIVPMLHVASGADALPFDWKERAAGGREPGEDDE